jgi:hypothetical protein
MVPIETLTNPGAIHWGVMLAQGWKGELAETGRHDAWLVARDWAQKAEQLGFHGIWVFDHFQPLPSPGQQPGPGSVDHAGRAVADNRPCGDRHARVVRRVPPSRCHSEDG